MTLLTDGPPASREALAAWLRDADVTVHPSLRIEDMSDGSGWRVVAEEDIDEYELLFSAPKSALLSTRSSSLRLPARLMNAASTSSETNVSLLSLALCILHELRLGNESRWYGYLQSLPREDETAGLLPAFWDTEKVESDGAVGRRWLGGTDAQADLARREAQGLGTESILSFYASTSPLLPPTPTHPDPSPPEAYLHAFTLLSTRAFLIDLYHTTALVPFADILNHSATPHTSLASDEFVCHRCGSMAVCAHDVIPPEGAAPVRLAHLPMNVALRVGRMKPEEDTVEMFAERAVGKGEEVWNTYGEMGDARLLVEYGFVGDEYAGEGVGVRLQETEVEPRAVARWRELVEDERVVRVLTEPLAGEEKNSSAALPNAFEALSIDAPGNADEPATASPRDDLQVDDALVTITPESASHLFISHSAQVSLGLFTLVCVSTFTSEGGSHTSAPDEMASSIRAALYELQRIYAAVGADEGDSASSQAPAAPVELDMSLSSGTVDVCRAMIEVIDRRIDQLYGADKSIDELITIRDRLDDQAQRRTRLAMALNINERSVLRTARAKWDLVAEALGSAIEGDEDGDDSDVDEGESHEEDCSSDGSTS